MNFPVELWCYQEILGICPETA